MFWTWEPVAHTCNTSNSGCHCVPPTWQSETATQKSNKRHVSGEKEAACRLVSRGNSPSSPRSFNLWLQFASWIPWEDGAWIGFHDFSSQGQPEQYCDWSCEPWDGDKGAPCVRTLCSRGLEACPASPGHVAQNVRLRHSGKRATHESIWYDCTSLGLEQTQAKKSFIGSNKQPGFEAGIKKVLTEGWKTSP